MTRALLLALLLAVLPLSGPSRAQQGGPATLVADRIDFDEARLSASGNVEIFADGRVLRARRVTYLRGEDRVVVEGPLTLIDGPDAILVADFASLSGDLRNSVLRGARLVLDRRLQIAAAEISTGAEGRFTQLDQSVASSCTICAAAPIPIWQIRARRIVHDRETRQLYFENARFEVAGVPVAWFPSLRLPDPTLARSRGVLAPRFSSDGLLGTGVAVPYFIPLGPSRDLTLTPFLTNQEARNLGFRYRQAIDSGSLAIAGAYARDHIQPGDGRGYVFAEGTFFLPRDYRLEFDVETTSDDAYLLDYDVTEADRLASRLAVTRIDRDDRFLAEITAFDTLRDDEEDRFLPSPVVTVERQRRVPGRVAGGQLVWTLQAHARQRSADPSGIPAGGPPDSARDVLRASAGLDWRRDAVTEAGLVWTGMAGLQTDAYDVSQDARFGDGTLVRAVPYAGVQLRYPLARAGAEGVRHLLAPSLQLLVAPKDVKRTPNEDSLTPEFDEGNLFSTQRFAGRDRREQGTRLNLGVGYTRFDPSGWTVDATAGRILRLEDLGQFRPGTPLAGTSSDWLVSVGATYGDGFEVLSRAIVSDGIEVASSETVLRWRGDRHDLATRYTWLEADAGAGQPLDTGEWQLDAAYDLTRDWTGRVRWRYDSVTNDASRAGLGLTYRSDCVTVAFDVERRYTSFDVTEPTTRFGLGVELAGFGADESRRTRRRCGL